jgi:hypothetical protein
MKITLEMPGVSACEAVHCVYNTDRRCHARAITVGDGIHPACDTFLSAREHVDGSADAGVGACKVTACLHNTEYECGAPEIRVGVHESHADCLTFEAR